MDGGTKQKEMSAQIRRDVKGNAHRVPRRQADTFSNQAFGVEAFNTGNARILLPTLPGGPISFAAEDFMPLQDIHRENGLHTPGLESSGCPPRKTDCTLTGNNSVEGITFGRSDTVQLMFYLEHLLPFLFPFYNPSILQGGRAWILELMLRSPVVREATLCLSSHFFSLLFGTANQETRLEMVLMQTKAAFETLRHALQVISNSSVAEHIHGAVRTFASIMQIQRFEIAVSNFDHCQAHLNAGLTLFKELLNCNTVELGWQSASFFAVLDHLGSSSLVLPGQSIQVPSAEQAAFRFSSALLVLDDIIASTVLQQQPTLYRYHCSLLGNLSGTEPPINLEAVIGCQNWVLHQISEIAAIDAWKQQCKVAGSLDIMELVNRATSIKVVLESHLTTPQASPASIISSGREDLLNVFASSSDRHATSQTCLVTRIWAHAALIYLSVVVSGWQPASPDVRYNVGQVIELLSNQLLPHPLLRTMVWPFCVAGCLAEPCQQPRFQNLGVGLQPPTVFGTVHKALEIMENVWHDRKVGDVSNRDLAACFRSQGDDLVLLV